MALRLNTIRCLHSHIAKVKNLFSLAKASPRYSSLLGPCRQRMGVITASQELSTPVAASRMFKAYILDTPTLFKKLEPNIIKNIEFIEGDGGVGSIQLTTFQEGYQSKDMKHRIDVLDKDNLYCKYTLIEGGPLDDTFVSMEFVVKFESVGTGTVCNMTKHFHIKDGGMVNEEEITKLWKHKSKAVYKLVEEYLLANPDAYA